MLSVLDDMSATEMRMLAILHDLTAGAAPPDPGGDEFHRAASVRDEFARAVATELGVDRECLPGVLARLNRTGLYCTFSGAWFGPQQLGTVTPSLGRLLEVLDLPVDPGRAGEERKRR